MKKFGRKEIHLLAAPQHAPKTRVRPVLCGAYHSKYRKETAYPNMTTCVHCIAKARAANKEYRAEFPEGYDYPYLGLATDLQALRGLKKAKKSQNDPHADYTLKSSSPVYKCVVRKDENAAYKWAKLVERIKLNKSDSISIERRPHTLILNCPTYGTFNDTREMLIALAAHFKSNI